MTDLAKYQQELKPEDYKFCPKCGANLETRVEEGTGRQTCPQCHWTYYPRPAIAVGAILRDKRGKVLLVQRARAPKQGEWQLPAGFLEFGEHPEETLVRELLEETGLKVSSWRLEAVKLALDDPRAPKTVVLFYQVDLPENIRLVNDPAENLKLDWFGLKDLPQIAWESHIQVLDKLA
jgi:8-oxo-dGTP pyrophosphatase MutT (NUDIX family)